MTCSIMPTFSMKRLCFPLFFAAWIAPADAAPRLPPSVRALMPKNGVSLRIFRLAPAPKATQYLIHLWTVRRPKSIKHPAESFRREIASPFVLDVFTNEKTPQYQTSYIYAASRAPSKVSLRYLHLKTKIGLVFELEDNRPTPWSFFSTNTFFVAPFALGNPYFTQTFESWGNRESNIYSVARDSEGTLQLVHRIDAHGAPRRVTQYLKWDGERFANQERKVRLRG